jgi:hypothetical protein
MDRRSFMRDVTQVGIGLGVTGSLADAATPLAPASAEGAGWSSQAATPMISLDGEWYLATDAQNEGREQRWYLRPSPEAKRGRVPGIFQEVFPKYHGVVWYWLEFTPPAHPHPQGRYLLHFGAVDYSAEVWLNGQSAGGHEGSETPFVLDVTAAVQPQASNLLAVRVLKPGDTPIDGYVLKEIPHRNEMVDYVPGNGFDIGGIVEPVEFLLPPGVRVEDVFVRPDWKTGDIRLRANIRNALQKPTRSDLHWAVAPASTGKTLLAGHLGKDLPAGDTLIETQLHVDGHRLWDLDDPYLYRVTVRVSAEGVKGFDEASVRCGFRDFRVERGYFRLNGKRIFLRSTHTGNHCPLSQTLPPAGAPDFLRLDMLYAKASGFNTVRFISGVAHPYQLDMCDEIGLLVYEESLAGWMLADSPKMKLRYESSVREMILRDRNHPSLAMWGMLNETKDGPVYREAVSALPVVRSLDDSRLVLLSSGRWDGHLSVGSVSNPGSDDWDHVWGDEAPDAPSVATDHLEDYWLKTGDIHYYPRVPQTPESESELRTVGQNSKPVFLSEYGIGSMMDVIHEGRMYEQLGVRADTEDYAIVRSIADKLTADWKRFGMEGVYAFPAYFLRDSQARMARHRLLGFNLIRSNPKICGFNLTGMLDHALTGEGVWRFWRDWKPGVMDAMKDGWTPLRWCLFANPTHTYLGRPVKLEGVLANEDVLRPGDYPVRFRVCGPAGMAWERAATVHVPALPDGEEGPLAIPVMAEDVVLEGREGDYELTAYIEQGAAATEACWQFHLTDSKSLPRLEQIVTTWGIPANVQSWLKSQGVSSEEFQRAARTRREVILVGDPPGAEKSNGENWRELARRLARGSTVLFLSHDAFEREKDPVGWLPLAKKGRCYKFNDWLYHKECVAKAHPVFDGLQGKGILDWYYYGPVIPHFLFEGQETPSEVIAAAFAAGYSTPGGYASGILLGSYHFGEGQFIVSTFPVLEQLNLHPVADRLLVNLIKYASGGIAKPPAELPADFDAQLRSIGYTK